MSLGTCPTCGLLMQTQAHRRGYIQLAMVLTGYTGERFPFDAHEWTTPLVDQSCVRAAQIIQAMTPLPRTPEMCWEDHGRV